MTTLSTPSGSPASAKISAQSRPPEIGDHSDGFSTTVLPSASGAAMERAERIKRDVPRGDRGHDADRSPKAHRQRSGRVGRDHGPDRRVRERCGLTQEAGDEVHLEHADAEARAGLPRKQLDDLVAAALEHVGGLEEDPLPLGRQHGRPAGECRCGSLDRPAGIRGGAGGRRSRRAHR